MSKCWLGFCLAGDSADNLTRVKEETGSEPSFSAWRVGNTWRADISKGLKTSPCAASHPEGNGQDGHDVRPQHAHFTGHLHPRALEPHHPPSLKTANTDISETQSHQSALHQHGPFGRRPLQPAEIPHGGPRGPEVRSACGNPKENV